MNIGRFDEVLMKNLHESEGLWCSGEEDSGILCTQLPTSTYIPEDKSAFCPFTNSQTKVKEISMLCLGTDKLRYLFIGQWSGEKGIFSTTICL